MLALSKDNSKEINENKIVDQIRALALDMIQEAGSGHPGIVLGAAPILYTLYAHHLHFDAKHPDYFNRDRFVMSSGHGSALLYATLSLAGYDIELEDLKQFRKLGSITPGHPEYKKTQGVEMTTGPLGQGFAAAVGMAIAEKHSAALLNTKKSNLIDYNIYCLCGEGDLMEGITYEAASLAGVNVLDNLIVLYDCNHVSLDGPTDMTFIDNIEQRFTAMNWEVITATDEVSSIDKALEKAKSNSKPTLIQVKTTIGKYSSLAGTNKIHGGILQEDDLENIKQQLNVRNIPFTISNEVLTDFQSMIEERNKGKYEAFLEEIQTLDENEKNILQQLQNKDKTIELTTIDYEKPQEDAEYLKEASNKMLNSYAAISPLIIGGSADVATSTMAYLKNMPTFSSKDYSGRNIAFGVREAAMAAIANGLALSGYRPFISTYLSFSDYLKPALRLACMMNLPITYIFTHDSISVGEDGPTHQPIEQLVSLRATPNLTVYRPADSNEVIGVYKTIYQQEMPAAIILSRNKTKMLETTSIPLVADGAYIIKNEERKLDGIIIATGEEVALALEVSEALQEKGYDLRVISMPSLDHYKRLDKTLQEQLLPAGIKKFVIERSSSYSWYEFVYNDNYLFTVDTFGASGSKQALDEAFGFTKEAISLKIEELLK